MDELLNLPLAENTLTWSDDNNFSFLWRSIVIFVYYNSDYDYYRVINVVGPKILNEIDEWLSNKQPLPERDDNEEEN